MTYAPTARSMTRTPRVDAAGRHLLRGSPTGWSSRLEDFVPAVVRASSLGTNLDPTRLPMPPDRVDTRRSESPAVPPRRRFEEALRGRIERCRKPPGPPRQQRTSTPARVPPVPARAARAARASGELRTQARQEMDISARRRVAEGTVATDHATGRLEARAADLLSTALRTEETARSEPAAGLLARTAVPSAVLELSGEFGALTPTSGGACAKTAAPHLSSEGRIERALALVERIERFVRNGRPSLVLTLRGGVAGELEVQRVARGAIAVRIVSPRPPSANELGELRQALEARGLSVRTLEARRTETGGGAREDRDAIAAAAEKRGGRGPRVP
jgi:hypothetical protein